MWKVGVFLYRMILSSNFLESVLHIAIKLGKHRGAHAHVIYIETFWKEAGTATPITLSVPVTVRRQCACRKN